MSRTLVGSLRRDSYTRRLVGALADLAKPSMLIDVDPPDRRRDVSLAINALQLHNV
jgi:NAD(P)H-dependent FMN reductase